MARGGGRGVKQGAGVLSVTKLNAVAIIFLLSLTKLEQFVYRGVRLAEAIYGNSRGVIFLVTHCHVISLPNRQCLTTKKRRYLKHKSYIDQIIALNGLLLVGLQLREIHFPTQLADQS